MPNNHNSKHNLGLQIPHIDESHCILCWQKKSVEFLKMYDTVRSARNADLVPTIVRATLSSWPAPVLK